MRPPLPAAGRRWDPLDSRGCACVASAAPWHGHLQPAPHPLKSLRGTEISVPGSAPPVGAAKQPLPFKSALLGDRNRAQDTFRWMSRKMTFASMRGVQLNYTPDRQRSGVFFLSSWSRPANSWTPVRQSLGTQMDKIFSKLVINGRTEKIFSRMSFENPGRRKTASPPGHANRSR